MNLSKLRFVIAATALLVTGNQVSAETQRLQVGIAPSRMMLLKPGSHRYLRYEVKDGRRVARDIWDRTILFETRGGRRQLHITQRWDEVNVAPGKPSSVEQDSWFEASTFRPLTQERRVTIGNDVKVTGYRFLADKAVSDNALPDNQDRFFSQSYAEVPFNFEYDMEMFQVLPLHAEYEANIPFLDVGIDKNADRYTFKVAGSDRIVGWDGTSLDCWVITSDYNSGKIKNRWWVSKVSQVVVREESKRNDGSTFVKALLPPEAEDDPL